MELYSIAATAWLSPSLSPSVMQYGTSIPTTRRVGSNREAANACRRRRARLTTTHTADACTTTRGKTRHHAHGKTNAAVQLAASRAANRPNNHRHHASSPVQIPTSIGAISTEELRSHPQVIGLPPADGVQLAGPKSFHWVRQDDPLWDDLHEGVLTLEAFIERARHARGTRG